jgi:hypothetical protein
MKKITGRGGVGKEVELLGSIDAENKGGKNKELKNNRFYFSHTKRINDIKKEGAKKRNIVSGRKKQRSRSQDYQRRKTIY